MTFYQISVNGDKPSGRLFETHQDAELKIDLMLSDDIRYQDDAEGGSPSIRNTSNNPSS